MAIPDSLEKTIEAMAECLQGLPTHWDGKEAILELKAADYQWRQMEWIGFYFEYKAKQALAQLCTVPGDKINKVEFDLKKDINFDLKAKAIKSDAHRVILNDVEAMQLSINSHGLHGEIIALVDVDYNDDNRQFQQWHSALKGGLSKYEQERCARTSTSRYRKTQATLVEIIFVILGTEDLENLHIMNQGKKGPELSQYMLDLEEISNFRYSKIEF